MLTSGDNGEPEKLTRRDFEGFLGKEQRKTTDVLFLIIYIAFWVVSFIMVGYSAGQAGGLNGYRRLTGGTQIDGRICGLGGEDGAGETFDRAFFFESDLYTNAAATAKVTADLSAADGILCIESCPATFSDSPAVGECRQGVVEGRLVSGDGQQEVAVFACAYDSKSVYWHYCEPTEDSLETTAAKAVFDDFVSTNEYALAVLELATASTALLFLIAILVAVALSIVYILLMRYAAALVTWIVLALTVLAGALAGYFLYFHATDSAELEKYVGSQDPETFKGMAALTWTLTAIFLLVVLCSFRRINLAVRIVQEGTHAVLQMPSVFLTPFIKTLALVGMMCYWCVGCVYIMSGAELQDVAGGAVDVGGIEIQLKTPVWDEELRYFAIYHFFGLLWGTAFIVALGQLVLSLAVTKWYFTPDVDGVRDVSSPLCGSLYIALRYHLGTVAFGSLLVAIVKMMRATLEYVNKRIKASGGENPVVKAVVCTCRCCLWCLEACIKFVNKQAYIATAIFGLSFCPAAAKAVGLMLRNAGRVGALNMIGGVIEIIGAVFVSAFVTFVSYALVINSEYFGENVSDPIYPVVVAGVLAFTVGYLFMQVFGHAADVLLMCFVADEEMNNGQAEFAPHSLGSAVDAHGAAPASGNGDGSLNYKPHSQI